MEMYLAALLGKGPFFFDSLWHYTFCGGLDFQEIWVKISDILPYLYGYGLKKMEI